ncbi:MAG: helix-turn-helix domain-containing protein [Chloroflexota bacterium]|nr:helix-turn-helix domain-containing protein [Chloroflexota bacterium]
MTYTVAPGDTWRNQANRSKGDELEAEVEQKEWFTTDELVRWLGLGRTKTYEMLRSGEIPSYKIGRVRRIRRQDVEAWLESNRFRPGE